MMIDALLSLASSQKSCGGASSKNLLLFISVNFLLLTATTSFTSRRVGSVTRSSSTNIGINSKCSTGVNSNCISSLLKNTKKNTAPFFSSSSIMTVMASSSSSSDNNNSSSSDENMNEKQQLLLQAILWDMDGVLAETERDGHRVAFNEIFEQYKLNTYWDVDEYGKLLEVGGGKERMTAHWNQVGWPTTSSTKNSNDESFFVENDTNEARQAKVKELHLAKTDAFNEIIKAGNVPLRPGVQRLIDDAISNDVQLAVCSTSNEKAVSNLVTTLLGPERASKIRIFAGDVVKNKKPSPDVYNLAVDTLNLDKNRCLIVEDSGIGYQAANAAGICCIVTTNGYTEHENFNGADLIVPDLDNNADDKVTLETVHELLTVRKK